MTACRLLHGDCREVLRTLPDASIDSAVTDPPYELGFMGKGWDCTGIAYDPAVWREVLRVLKPGAHLLAFSGTRTYHRMACAIEDAGFEVRDQIGWVYGSGFPKSLDVAKAIDKSAGERRPVIRGVSDRRDDGTVCGLGHTGAITSGVPTTAAAAAWRGWGTALKPAWEPIVVARKPLAGSVAANVLAHGTGALNIDGCRVEGPGGTKWEKPRGGIWSTDSDATANLVQNALGRWPANLIHDGSDEVLAAFPAESSQTGNRSDRSRAAPVDGTGWLNNNHQSAEYTDSGSPARFFYCAKADAADRADGLHSVSRRGRNHHPTVKPTDLMRWLCRLVTPPGGTVLDPFMGTGSTLKAAELEGFDAVGIELDETYLEVARRRIGADAPLFCPVPDVEVMP